MKISLIGAGCGTPATLTEEGRKALESAQIVFGAARVLEGISEIPELGSGPERKVVVEAKPKRICSLLAGYIEAGDIANAAVALSGDSGFYSGARLLKKRISERFADTEIEILPGISSVQAFAARLAVPWQDWNLVSAHGVDCDPVYEIMKGKETFFLTGGKYTADVICRELAKAGLGELRVTVGENLSYVEKSYESSALRDTEESLIVSDRMTGEISAAPDRKSECAGAEHHEPSGAQAASEEGIALNARSERIVTATAAECADMTFSDMAVVLVDTKNPDGKTLIVPRKAAGIPDSAFIRAKVPMTKMEVRCIVLGKMAVSENEVVWDIGAGTGSVSIELAMQARQVWALERNEEGIALIRENREKFGRWNLHAVQGEAPEELEKLPVPDAVFVGGSGGHLKEILRDVWRRNGDARICISAVLLETLQESVEAFAERDIEPDIVQIAVSRADTVGGKHMMKAGNPIYIVSG